jgi:hypothetical protein
MTAFERAREIIRISLPDFCLLHNSNDVNDYNAHLDSEAGNCPLTAEEYELLYRLYIF